eukprot:2075468-Amphidinium_carterae.1
MSASVLKKGSRHSRRLGSFQGDLGVRARLLALALISSFQQSLKEGLVTALNIAHTTAKRERKDDGTLYSTQSCACEQG